MTLAAASAISAEAGFTVIQTLEQLADIEAADECHLVEFGRPTSSYFAQAAKKFGDVKSSGCASAFKVENHTATVIPDYLYFVFSIGRLKFAMSLPAWNEDSPTAEDDAFVGLDRASLTSEETDAFNALGRHGLWLFSTKANPAGAQVTELPSGWLIDVLRGLLRIEPTPVAARMDTVESIHSIMKTVAASLKSQGAVRVDGIWMKNGTARAEEWKLSDEPEAAAWRRLRQNSTDSSPEAEAPKDEV